MDCFYINLDSETDRKLSITSSFASNADSRWLLTRVPAIDVSYVAQNQIKGTLRAEEKACFLSHRKIIADNAEAGRNIFILEDDVIFGKKTCYFVDLFLNGTAKNLDWDILFTDVGVTHIGVMADFLLQKRKLLGKNQINIVNLDEVVFFGATAYIINKKSLGKVSKILSDVDKFNIPYDTFLRKLVHDRELNGYVLFPFVTSLSDLSRKSQVQPEQTASADRTWNLFRQLIWFEGSVTAHEAMLQEIGRDVGAEARAYATLWGAMADPSFKRMADPNFERKGMEHVLQEGGRLLEADVLTRDTNELFYTKPQEV